MKVPNSCMRLRVSFLSLSRLQNEGSQPVFEVGKDPGKSIKATE